MQLNLLGSLRRFAAGGGVARLQVQVLAMKKRAHEGFGLGFMVAGYVSHTRVNTTLNIFFNITWYFVLL